MRLLLASLAAVAALLPAATAAPAAVPGPAGLPCAAGPVTVGATTYGTACADFMVVPAGVQAVKGGGGDDTIVPAPIAAASDPCPIGCFLGIGSQTFEGGPGDDVVTQPRSLVPAEDVPTRQPAR